jgi:hypothetical protein
MADKPPTSPILFDRALLNRRLQRAAALGPATFLLDRVADDLADRLAVVLRRFDVAADIGTPGAAVRAALKRVGSVGTLLRTGALIDHRDGGAENFIVADLEALPFADASLDLAV